MAECVFSGRLWPIHPKPLPDELLSSWIVRLSLAQGVKPYSFLQQGWPEEQSLRHNDIDRTTNEKLWGRLSEKTGTPLLDAFHTTLSSYEGWLQANPTKRGLINWLMPINFLHRPNTKRYGLQFCPLCLAEDVRPYFRRKWRLAFIYMCAKHRVLLRDRCPQCREPVNYYKAAQKYLQALGNDALIACQGCQFELRKVGERSDLGTVTTDEIKFQEILADTLDRGWIDVPQQGRIYSCLYFDGLRQLMGLITSRRHSIRELIIKHFNITSPVTIPPGYSYLEGFDIPNRRAMVNLVRKLLDNWPNGFIDFSETNKIWSRMWFHHMDYIPFWYWHLVNDNLNRAKYWLPDQELDSVVRHIQSKGFEPTSGQIGKYLYPHSGYMRLRKAGLKRRGYKGLIGYPESLKQEAIRLYEEGNSFKKVGEMLSISGAVVFDWVKARKASASHDSSASTTQ